jgi:hypothetical protein
VGGYDLTAERGRSLGTVGREPTRHRLRLGLGPRESEEPVSLPVGCALRVSGLLVATYNFIECSPKGVGKPTGAQPVQVA